MKTISEIRRANLLTLIDRAGTIADINESIGLDRTDATLRQIKNQSTTSRGNPKNMGEELARRIETALQLPVGWMDNDHTINPYATQAIAQAVQIMENMPAYLQQQSVQILSDRSTTPDKKE